MKERTLLQRMNDDCYTRKLFCQNENELIETRPCFGVKKVDTYLDIRVQSTNQ